MVLLFSYSSLARRFDRTSHVYLERNLDTGFQVSQANRRGDVSDRTRETMNDTGRFLFVMLCVCWGAVLMGLITRVLCWMFGDEKRR